MYNRTQKCEIAIKAAHHCKRVGVGMASGSTTDTHERFLDKLNREYIDESRDLVDAVDVVLGNVRSGALGPEEALERIRRETYNLRRLGRSVSLPAMTVVTHRMEDYVDSLDQLDASAVEDLQAFADKIRQMLNDPASMSAAKGEGAAKVARSLPAKRGFDISDIELRNVEIMLVEPQRATARIVERELAACGYRVTTVRSSFEAVELAVRMKPDMIIASATIDDLSGIDLACGLAAMPTTQSIPFAVLTSYGWGHKALQPLPARRRHHPQGGRFRRRSGRSAGEV